MSRFHARAFLRRAGAFAISLLLTAGALSGQTPGRLSLTVLDGAGRPLADVAARLSCADLPRFEQLRRSDAKGRMLLTVPDITKRYSLRLDHSGYRTAEIELTVTPDEVERRQLQMTPIPPAPSTESAPPASADTQRADLHNRGVDALAARDFASARERFAAALAIDPRFVPSLLGLAQAELLSGDGAAACSAAERAVAEEPGSAQALALLLAAARLAKSPEKEAAALHALTQVDPKRTAAELVAAGILRFDAGDLGAAEELFRRALELDPAAAAGHYRLALCRLNAGDIGAARTHLQRFLELAPDDPAAETAAAMLRDLEGRRE